MNQPAPPSTFEDSRRLTGPNLYFDDTGAALETAIGPDVGQGLVAGWSGRVRAARIALGWPDGAICVRRHAGGASLAFAAPADCLYTATEVNEWAWQASLKAAGVEVVPFALPGHPALDDDAQALDVLCRLADQESVSKVRPLLDAARAHGVSALLDEDALSLGMGEGGRTWAIDALLDPGQVPWPRLRDIPIALVTGSNGKTTTVRLLAAMAGGHGWTTAHSCTDGLYVQGRLLEGGDYSGPAGARTLLRRSEVQAAILETARGGLLRRGLAVRRAPVAVVTNVSPDHYGEYGIHDLDDLAQVKLTVARVIGAEGVLVLNADDALLCRRGAGLPCPLAWFALDDRHPLLLQSRAQGRRTCGVDAAARLRLFDGRDHHDLGAIADMPITLDASAGHNVANAAAAALAASALAIDAATIAAVLARFGRSHGDNPGRLQRWTLDGVSVFVDYAHNPDGLTGLLEVATRGRDPGAGRLALALGQAGNRRDAEIRDLALTAARFRPDLIVLKDMEGYERGRGPGEVPAVLRRALLEAGAVADTLEECLDEFTAVSRILAWSRPGDILVLPVHNTAVRDRVTGLLDRLESDGWRPGQPIPEMPAGQVPDSGALA